MKRYVKAVNIISILIMVTALIYIAWSWNTMPSRIAGHYNLYGEIDAYGDKSSVLELVVGMVFAYTAFLYMKKRAKTWRFSLCVATDRNSSLGIVLQAMLTTMQLFVMAGLMLMVIYAIKISNLPSWFTLILACGLVVPMVVIFAYVVVSIWREYYGNQKI